VVPVGAPAAATLPTRLSRGLLSWSDATFDSLRLRDYRLLFQGNGVTSLGFWMQQVAVGWLILDLSGSPFYLGLAGFFRAIPMLVISPFGGVIADRFNRRWVIAGTQVSQLLVSGTLAGLILTDRIAVWHLLFGTSMHGVSVALQIPARQALIPQLVGRKRLTNALAIYSMTQSSSRIVGPALAGVLMGSVGVAWCLVGQSLTYAWALVNILQMRVPSPKRVGAASATVFQHLGEGLTYCYQTKPLLVQLLLAMVPAIFAMPYYALLPAFARDVFHTGPGGLGILYATMGIGALSGSLLIASRRHIPNKPLLTVVCAAMFGTSLILFAAMSWLPLALVCLAAAGATSSAYTTLNSSLVQELAPDELRGRVSSLYILVWGLMPLGSVPAGAIAAAWGAPIAVGIGGSCCLLFVTGLLLARPQLART
jgi:MFS family permease